MPEIISREEAMARGLKRYFTGKPCCHGHVCERGMQRRCVECDRLEQARRRRKRGMVPRNPAPTSARRKEIAKKCYQKNLERRREKGLERYYANRDKCLKAMKARQERISDLLAVLRKEMPELLKEFGL